jgi:hypothetical protein
MRLENWHSPVTTAPLAVAISFACAPPTPQHAAAPENARQRPWPKAQGKRTSEKKEAASLLSGNVPLSLYEAGYAWVPKMLGATLKPEAGRYTCVGVSA